MLNVGVCCGKVALVEKEHWRQRVLCLIKNVSARCAPFAYALYRCDPGMTGRGRRQSFVGTAEYLRGDAHRARCRHVGVYARFVKLEQDRSNKIGNT